MNKDIEKEINSKFSDYPDVTNNLLRVLKSNEDKDIAPKIISGEIIIPKKLQLPNQEDVSFFTGFNREIHANNWGKYKLINIFLKYFNDEVYSFDTKDQIWITRTFKGSYNIECNDPRYLTP